MAILPRLTHANLWSTIAKFPPEVLRDDSARSFTLTVAIIKYYFGLDWLERHAGDSAPIDGVFRQRFDDPVKGEIQSFRLVDFSELLFNLQHIAGFDECIDRMRSGDVEGPLAELDFGRMLALNRIKFKFVIPQGVEGNDYDIEIFLNDGIGVCADAKCKIEATDYSEATVRNSLQKARKQFPGDKPSMIFIKVPSRWLTELDKGMELKAIAAKFLRGTGRIVSMKFYTMGLHYRNTIMSHVHAFDEVPNPKNRFDTERDWNLFDSTPEQRGLPDVWQRILFFPKKQA